MARTYKEIMDDVQKASYGKEMRKLHKELKEIDPGNGFPLFMRYPNLPDIAISISMGITLIVVAVVFIKAMI